jgi:hypothetical protein
MRNQLGDRSAGTEIAADAPGFSRYPIRLFARLIRARIAMSFGR